MDKNETLIGVCRFCGQYNLYSDMEGTSEAERNERATRQCNCDEGKKYAEQLAFEEKRKKQREETLLRASIQIEELFGEGARKQNFPSLSENYLTIFNNMAALIYDDVILKCNIDVTGLVKATISTNAKGVLQIQRTDKIVGKLEV
ncbi:hypothetical protein RBG61_02060 [Paludicola sp. MB14-C6]|uniref:hypothetical protein n=1 Tax=Paludihabitans sp. MB14-C6 TaxID=3070656 RepID=UPI0027DD46F9|nr:hypothetical protein [Paludicola sp. MB14-C6]WMJ23476.1 hypothetical protein RBG61_02060 [Paludicola sp. MB14-C6]